MFFGMCGTGAGTMAKKCTPDDIGGANRAMGDGYSKIPITLIDPVFSDKIGEQAAQACDNAWLRQFGVQMRLQESPDDHPCNIGRSGPERRLEENVGNLPYCGSTEAKKYSLRLI